jgi:hypothetical protein
MKGFLRPPVIVLPDTAEVPAKEIPSKETPPTKSGEPEEARKKGGVRRKPGKPEEAPGKVSGAVPYQPKITAGEARKTVVDTLGERVKLADYRSTIVDLTMEEREVVLDQAELMLDQVYVHLPLKRAMHSVEPIQRLRVLKLHHRMLQERAFQSAMIDVFVSVRDLHTNYVLPSGYRPKYAFLPFRVEEFWEGLALKYVVSWVSPLNGEKNLKEGVVVSHWNGSPIDLVVARNAEREAGSNPEARRARGVEALTLRWLGMSLPPDEDWVTLTYRDGVKTYESRFDWEVIDRADLRDTGLGTSAALAGELAWGVDLKSLLLQRLRKALFDPPAMKVEDAVVESKAGGLPSTVSALPAANVSHFPDVFPRFGPVETPAGTFAYVRLATFAPDQRFGSVDDAVKELVRILSSLPQNGLILDVRGNGGGVINFGERILQLLSPRAITPEPFHFISNALTLRIAGSDGGFREWQDPISVGIEMGGSFSQGFPLTAPSACNDIGQVYQGPVVLITDALCYSTTDIFAAGFQDHEVGTILGAHRNTGAGGANVWDHSTVLQILPLLPSNPFVPLPQGVGMRVAARRSTRLGKRSGVPLEDLGVVPEVYHPMTLNDVLDHNADLISHAAQILAGKPKQTLRMTVTTEAAKPKVRIETSNIDRVDLAIDARPAVSQDIKEGTAEVLLPASIPAGAVITARGYRGGELVVSSRSRV